MVGALGYIYIYIYMCVCFSPWNPAENNTTTAGRANYRSNVEGPPKVGAAPVFGPALHRSEALESQRCQAHVDPVSRIDHPWDWHYTTPASKPPLA